MQFNYFNLFMCLNRVGPVIQTVEDFECYYEYGNRVAMDDTEFTLLKSGVDRHFPRKPFYVCTINKSNTIRGKAKMVNLQT